jgi:hypothetical protein
MESKDYRPQMLFAFHPTLKVNDKAQNGIMRAVARARKKTMLKLNGDRGNSVKAKSSMEIFDEVSPTRKRV